MSEANESKQVKKHGGSRKVLTWQEKLELANKHVVRSFLASKECGCDRNCIIKINKCKEAGVEMVANLRDARFAGKTCPK